MNKVWRVYYEWNWMRYKVNVEVSSIYRKEWLYYMYVRMIKTYITYIIYIYIYIYIYM